MIDELIDVKYCTDGKNVFDLNFSDVLNDLTFFCYYFWKLFFDYNSKGIHLM